MADPDETSGGRELRLQLGGAHMFIRAAKFSSKWAAKRQLKQAQDLAQPPQYPGLPRNTGFVLPPPQNSVGRFQQVAMGGLRLTPASSSGARGLSSC